MIRTVLFISAVALANLAFSQVKPDAGKDFKQMPSQNAMATPNAGQITPVSPSNTTIPVGKCCKVNVAYPASPETALSQAKTSSINNAIPELTADECAKNSCKIEIVDANGRPVLKGWNVVLDKNNNPTIDARALPKGKYKIRFMSGVKKAEKAIDF